MAPPSRPSHSPPSNSLRSLEGAEFTETLARRETRVVACLRGAVLGVLVAIACVLCTVVYRYTHNEENQEFTSSFEDAAYQLIDSFHTAVDHNMAAVAGLSTTITSYAIQSNQSFPFVTIPDFELKGADVRAQSGSHLIHWTPMVTDETREDWEMYAMYNRGHWQASFDKEATFRSQQDAEYAHRSQRNLQSAANDVPGLSVLDDGTGYHPRIYSNGAITPRGDEPEGTGRSFLPLWQPSPVYSRSQEFMNLNILGGALILRNLVETMATQKKAVLNYAATPIPAYRPYFESILRSSQYRHDVEDLIDDHHTLMAYPVFDSFEDDQQLAGVVFSDIYWKILFSNLLPPKAQGIICVITNSINQTFSYRVDGGQATNLGVGDSHDSKYDKYMISTNVNQYLKDRASPQNKAYRTVQLSDSVQYTITVYPTDDTADQYFTNNPTLYTVVTLLAFLIAAVLFLLYSYVVEYRQGVMTSKVVENINKAAETERDLNEFLSHEIRNPLSAAMSASTFVSTAVNEEEPMKDEETKKYVREDMEVVNSSLHFINDFLRSMLDIYRAKGNKITIALAPIDIKQDILEPVASMLYKRLSSFEILVECPQDLVVMSDSIRLKQVIINLCRNASKFVERGFLRMRAEVVDHQVRISIEDSGPGVPPSKQKALFAKYQESLDLLSQGTGIGLNLSKKLMNIMGGDLWLDTGYDSGIDGYPGARFVVDLKTPPIDIEAALPVDDHASQVTGLFAIPMGDSTTITTTTIPLKADAGASEAEQSTGPKEKELTVGRDTQSQLNADNDSSVPPKDPQLPNKSTPAASSTEMELPENLSCLFVDDDAVLRKLFIRAVKKAAPASWTIKDASSGEMALRICETESFDIIFLDQYMASVEKQLLGTETAQAMRANGVNSKICGLSANDLRDVFVNAGADDFILKPMPCKPLELKGVLHSLLSHRSGAQMMEVPLSEASTTHDDSTTPSSLNGILVEC